MTISTIHAFAEDDAAATDAALKSNMSYFFGYSFGSSLLRGGNEEVDMDSLMSGLKDALSQADPALTSEQQQAVIALIRERQAEQQQKMQEMRDQFLQESLKQAAEYMKTNGTRDVISETPSGLQYEVVQEGTGMMPSANSRVRVHYEGTLTDGSVFDSSIQRGTPAEFGLQQVIAGWTEGLQLMKEGGKYRFYIPPELGYGAGGAGESIPPNAVLIFDVELIKVLNDA